MIYKYSIVFLSIIIANNASQLPGNQFMFHLFGGPGVIGMLVYLFIFRNVQASYIKIIAGVFMSAIIGSITEISFRVNPFVWSEHLSEEVLYAVVIFIPAQLISFTILFLLCQSIRNRLL